MNIPKKPTAFSIDSANFKNKKFLLKWLGILAALGVLVFIAGYFVGQALNEWVN